MFFSSDHEGLPLDPNLFSDCAVTGDHRERPWKDFWPPKAEAIPSTWAKSEFPSVASWRFDPSVPFERPWRHWTRTLQARKETANVGSAAATCPASDTYEVHASDAGSGPSRKAACCLDADVAKRGLATVRVASLSYLSPLERYKAEKPYLSRLPSLPGFLRTNISGDSLAVRVHEITGQEDLFTLDASGFEFTRFAASLNTWNDATVSSSYLPALAAWLKVHLRCSEVHVYAYNFRSNTPSNDNRHSWKAPFFRAHCDATAASCARRLQLYLPDHKCHDRRRVRFLNIWRALTTPLQDSPLALCDSRTIAPEDLVAADIIFPHYLDEAYEVRHNPDHRWFYKQGMTDDDVIVFKLSDTASGVAQTCPHSAFMDPTVPPDTPERASIEVRVIAIG